jgi:multicomponent Na+:H+ antiporter subunit E
MNRTFIFAVTALTVIWCILREEFSPSAVGTGFFVGVVCLFLYRKLLPFPILSDFYILKLIPYPFFLLFRVYVGGISAIKLILTGAEVEITEIKTELTSTFLRTLLVNSITLVPGSISLDLKDDTITVLMLKEKNSEMKDIDRILKGNMEKMLLRAQRKNLC